MSWDVALVRIRGDYRPIADVKEDDYLPLGKPAAVRKAIRTAFPQAEWSSTDWALFRGNGYEIEFSLEGVASANTVILHVHGIGDPIRPILKLTNAQGWLAVDCSTGEFLDPTNPSYEGWDGFMALVARSEEPRSEPLTTTVEPAEWPLSGLERGPNDRYVYLQFLPGESPRKLRNAVFRHWRDLAQEHGEMAGISSTLRLVLQISLSNTGLHITRKFSYSFRSVLT